MRIAKFLVIAVLLPAVAAAQPLRKREPTALEKSLASAGLTWSMPAEFAPIAIKKNRAMAYDIAIKAKKVKLEARYAIRFHTAEPADGKDANKIVVGGTALFQGLFTTTILNISGGEDAPVAWFDAKAASTEFGTPEGATATFAPAAAGWTGYKRCMMVGIRKGGAEAYAFFLFDDLETVEPALRKAFNALRFAADAPATTPAPVRSE